MRPENYYVFCTMPLNPQQKDEIVSMFSDFIKDYTHIMDGIEINDFLKFEENHSIVLKNHKLWFTTTNILSMVSDKNIYIDSLDLVKEIENNQKLFVVTKAYKEALKN